MTPIAEMILTDFVCATKIIVINSLEKDEAVINLFHPNEAFLAFDVEWSPFTTNPLPELIQISNSVYTIVWIMSSLEYTATASLKKYFGYRMVAFACMNDVVVLDRIGIKVVAYDIQKMMFEGGGSLKTWAAILFGWRVKKMKWKKSFKADYAMIKYGAIDAVVTYLLAMTKNRYAYIESLESMHKYLPSYRVDCILLDDNVDEKVPWLHEYCPFYMSYYDLPNYLPTYYRVMDGKLITPQRIKKYTCVCGSKFVTKPSMNAHYSTCIDYQITQLTLEKN